MRHLILIIRFSKIRKSDKRLYRWGHGKQAPSHCQSEQKLVQTLRRAMYKSSDPTIQLLRISPIDTFVWKYLFKMYPFLHFFAKENARKQLKCPSIGHWWNYGTLTSGILCFCKIKMTIFFIYWFGKIPKIYC